jgi:uncharacterized protein
MSNWVSPTKIVIGSVATGINYYPRHEITAKIWEELEKGNHILLAAPRRVGKTSVMKAMLNNTNPGYNLTFESVQNVSSAEQLFQRMYELMLKSLSTTEVHKKKFAAWFKSKNLTEVEILKGRFKWDKKQIDYLNEIDELAEQLKENEETIVLLIDELPEVLFKIYKDGNATEANHILKTMRKWRQSGEYSNIKFVLAGSIGIHFVVQHITGRSSDINDLAKIQYDPMPLEDAQNYIDWATDGATITYNLELKNYILDKIKYHVPYFINLLLNEIDHQARRANESEVTKVDINNAFNEVVKNNDYFKEWFSRLKDYMPQPDFLFSNEVLIHIAHKNYITIQEIYNMAQKHNKTAEYMLLIEDLENDGYIVKNNQNYIFISPYLQSFWLNINPIYNG